MASPSERGAHVGVDVEIARGLTDSEKTRRMCLCVGAESFYECLDRGGRERMKL